jgi:integrase
VDDRRVCGAGSVTIGIDLTYIDGILKTASATGKCRSIRPRCRMYAHGIDNLKFHDLRHGGVSRLFEQGYSIEQVALVSGHRDWKMLARYTQIKAKDLHRNLDEGQRSATSA